MNGFMIAAIAGVVLLQAHDGPAAPPAEKIEGTRAIAIPAQDIGYQHCKSMVVRLQEELDALLAQARKQSAWDNRKAFLRGLRDAKVDFAKQSLVLLRHTEGSVSVGIRFVPSRLRAGELICTIQRDVPLASAPALAYYCFALAVDIDRVREVALWIDGKPTETFTIRAK